MGSMPTSRSYFSSLHGVPKDEVFALMAAYNSDPSPDRVNLGAGVYCTDEGKSWPLSTVAKVEKLIHDREDVNRHDYIAIEGDPLFLKVARDLIFATTSLRQSIPMEDQVVSVQTISGTGANHVGARFLAEKLRPGCVWLSNPTWNNHHAIWGTVGVPQKLYPYYNTSTSTLDFENMISTLEREAQPQDVIVLHACAHNPTGLDPSQEQWAVIAELCQRKQLFAFFDNAYQGFASGNPIKDAWAINYFAQMQPPMEICVAQSFSKNFGLYGQRTGAFHLVVNESSPETRDKISSNLAQIIRSEYSVAPRYGSTIIRTILENDLLTQGWLEDLKVVSSRIRTMRHELYDEIRRLGTPGSWEHVINQIGMFSYTGLTESEVRILREQYHIYMLLSGRISIAGLNTKNVRYVAAAINAVRTQSLYDRS